MDINEEIATHCLALMSPFEDASCVQLRPTDAGVWNNVVLKVITPQQIYYFKQYREFTGISGYSPPRIRAEQRAQVAKIAQTAAAESCIEEYNLVPALLAADATAFIMAATSHTFA